MASVVANSVYSPFLAYPTMKNTLRHKSFTVIPLIAFLLLSVGCGDSGIGQVHGVVTLDGERLSNAVIEFYPQAGGAASAGRTDANGQYQIHRGRQGLGAVVGLHKVQIWTSVGIDVEDGPTPKERIPSKYNSSTELTAQVASGSNAIDFDLDSKGKITHQPGAR